MGAFCVFGISRSVCKAQAARRTPVEVTENGKRRHLTIAEWGVARDAMATRLFEQASKAGKVSPEFDAPQFCEDWLATAPGEVRSAAIMVRGGKVDKNGTPIKRNGIQVLTWLEYSAPEGRHEA